LPEDTAAELEPGGELVVVELGGGGAGGTVVVAGVPMLTGAKVTGVITPAVTGVPPPLDGGETPTGTPAPLGALVEEVAPAGAVALAGAVADPDPDPGEDEEAFGEGKYGTEEGGRGAALVRV
jgi:hypothetical protein